MLGTMIELVQTPCLDQSNHCGSETDFQKPDTSMKTMQGASTQMSRSDDYMCSSLDEDWMKKYGEEKQEILGTSIIKEPEERINQLKELDINSSKSTNNMAETKTLVQGQVHAQSSSSQSEQNDRMHSFEFNFPVNSIALN